MFKVKMLHCWICLLQTHRFSLYKMLVVGLEWRGLLWCFYQLLGLILMAPIHCRSSIGDVMLNLLKKIGRNTLIYIFGLRVIQFSFLGDCTFKSLVQVFTFLLLHVACVFNVVILELIIWILFYNWLDVHQNIGSILHNFTLIKVLAERSLNNKRESSNCDNLLHIMWQHALLFSHDHGKYSLE